MDERERVFALIDALRREAIAQGMERAADMEEKMAREVMTRSDPRSKTFFEIVVAIRAEAAKVRKGETP